MLKPTSLISFSKAWILLEFFSKLMKRENGVEIVFFFSSSYLKEIHMATLPGPGRARIQSYAEVQDLTVCPPQIPPRPAEDTSLWPERQDSHKTATREEVRRSSQQVRGNKKGAPLNREEEEYIIATFRNFDINGDGVLDKEEIREILTILNDDVPVKQKDLDFIFNTSDKNNSGSIDELEFLTVVKEWFGGKGTDDTSEEEDATEVATSRCCSVL